MFFEKIELASAARLSFGLSVVLGLSACVVVPKTSDNDKARCEISSDRKTLKIVNVAEETDTYYSISGLVLTPILVPATALISGTYVAVNNVYNLGEEKIKCGNK